MASYNKVILLGNLTRDPEVRVTPNGLTICKFGLAVNRVFNSNEGERREETVFVDCDAFGRQAETLSKYVTKGQPLFVEGRLKLDQWETKEGDKRSRLSVVVETFQFIGSSRGGESGETEVVAEAAPTRKSPASRPSPQAARSLPQNETDDDVPF
jgi:single-strand DNA-binding protein